MKKLIIMLVLGIFLTGCGNSTNLKVESKTKYGYTSKNTYTITVSWTVCTGVQRQETFYVDKETYDKYDVGEIILKSGV